MRQYRPRSKAEPMRAGAGYIHRGGCRVSASEGWQPPAAWSSAKNLSLARREDLIGVAWGGLPDIFDTSHGFLAFPYVPRTSTSDLGSLELMELISGDPSRRVRVLPPFGAFLVESDRAKVAVDEIGFFTIRPTAPASGGDLDLGRACWPCLTLQSLSRIRGRAITTRLAAGRTHDVLRRHEDPTRSLSDCGGRTSYRSSRTVCHYRSIRGRIQPGRPPTCCAAS